MTGYSQTQITHDNDADFDLLLKLMAAMVESQGGLPIGAGESWQNDRQTLAKKFIYHLSTIQAIRAGSKIRVNEVTHTFTDHGSITVLIRAVLENYVVFSYIYGSSDADCCHFRHMTWEYGGKMDRQRRLAITKTAREVQAREKPEAEALLKRIQAHPRFKNLSRGQQKSIVVKGDWSTGRSWTDLAIEAGLSERYFRNIYSYLCDYSHSSFAAAMQVGVADSYASGEPILNR